MPRKILTAAKQYGHGAALGLAIGSVVIVFVGAGAIGVTALLLLHRRFPSLASSELISRLCRYR